VIDLSTDTMEGSPDKSSLIFTPTDWDQAQTVTVTGVDDSSMDGDQNYWITLTIGTALTTDTTGYSALDHDDVSADNLDNETPKVTSSIPADGDVGIVLRPNIVVHFNTPMDIATITTHTDATCTGNSIQISEASADFATCIPMAGTPDASNDNKTFTLTLSAELSSEIT